MSQPQVKVNKPFLSLPMGNWNLEVNIRYAHRPVPVNGKGEQPLRKDGSPALEPCATIVELVENGPVGTKLVATGIATLHPKDNFNRSAGRKLALARALAQRFGGEGAKPQRQSVWNAYRQKIGHW